MHSFGVNSWTRDYEIWRYVFQYLEPCRRGSPVWQTDSIALAIAASNDERKNPLKCRNVRPVEWQEWIINDALFWQYLRSLVSQSREWLPVAVSVHASPLQSFYNQAVRKLPTMRRDGLLLYLLPFVKLDVHVDKSFVCTDFLDMNL